MPTWRDELFCLASAIRGHETLAASMSGGIFASQHYPLESALNIYRNNYRENLCDSLAAAYPILVQLVGSDFFGILARKFIEQHSSCSGNLHHYGAQLSEFLSNFSATKNLPYLPDFARLEWVCHQAYFAADPASFNPLRLHELDEAEYEKLIWLCHPACHVLFSPYPLLAIWQSHQPGVNADFRIDLDQGGGDLLVNRNLDVVKVSALSPETADWMRRIQAGITLGEATEATLDSYPDFDLPATLTMLVSDAVLINFRMPT